MRYNKEKTTLHYFNSIINIKEEITNNDIKNIYSLIAKHKINRYWTTFLKSKNIIYYEGDFLKWNEKIPVTLKLITEFRKYNSILSKQQKQQRQQRQETQQEINFIERQEMKSIQTPPPPKTRKRKTTVVFSDKPEPQVGLIRKFLRWLY
jgi:hypothetical protein